jgi:hypothetical protein
MLLAPELFDQILVSLDSDAALLAGATAGGGGQRRAPRFATTARVTLIPFAPGTEGLGGYDFLRDADGRLQLPLGQPQRVPVRDLSRGGMRFLMPCRIPLDTPFVLLLPRTGFDTVPLALEASVTYWQPVQRDLFAIGAQFRRELQGFVAPSATPALVLPNLPEEVCRQVG